MYTRVYTRVYTHVCTHVHTSTQRQTHICRPTLSLEDAQMQARWLPLREAVRPGRGMKLIFFIVFIHLFSSCLLSTYSMPGRQLSGRDRHTEFSPFGREWERS